MLWKGCEKKLLSKSYLLVADIGQLLKDVDFPAEKNKIIEFVKQRSDEQSK